MNVLVIGASRGIGLELARQHRAAGDAVVATARDDAGLARLSALGAEALRLDVAGAAGVSALSWPLDGRGFDTVWIVAGAYGSRLDPGQPPTDADFDAVMRTNVLGPMLLAPIVAEHLAPGARVGVLSSRMGSIGARTAASGSSLYRASKAAVNSVVRDAALGARARGSDATWAALHPGWVRTDMGGASADLDVAASAANLRATLARLGPADSGGFFDHDGTPIPW